MLKFVIPGRPKVQKNDLVIHKTKSGRSFVSHSATLASTRKEVAEICWAQYLSQGFKQPIDYFIDIDFVFYCTRQWEPDLDNLPAIVLDALQGFDAKSRGQKFKVCQVLSNDKLVRRLTAEKILEGEDRYDGEPRTEVSIRRYSYSGKEAAD